MASASPSPTTSRISHHTATVPGAELHYVAAGESGSPILLVHGFPESWWAFHKLIPLLAARHRVFAVDLRGFGDSSTADGDYDSTVVAEDLHQLIEHLGVGPVHLTGQDISGATVFRLASTHPENVRSFTAIEMGLAGFGLEAFADVTHGGSWHIGALAAAGIPEMLFAGRERELLGDWAFPSMTAVQGVITEDDIAEFARTYARPRRLARRRGPLPVDAGRGRGDQGDSERSPSHHAGPRSRGGRRSVHPVDGLSGRCWPGHVGATRRRGSLRSPRGT